MRARVEQGLVIAALVVLGAGHAPAAEVDGAKLYARHCAGCHGRSGRGDGPSAALFLTRPRNLREDFAPRHSTEELARHVREGRTLALTLYLPTLRERTGETEAVVAHMQRLPETDWPAVEEGWAIYVGRCQPCHGAFGRPQSAPPRGARTPRDLSAPDFQRAMSDEELAVAVRHGPAGMPELSPRLSEEQVRQVAEFVRLLSPGFEIYSDYCTNCHGDRGAPIGGLEGAWRVPTIVFDRAYFARRDPEELRVAIWHMLADQKPAVPHVGAALSEVEAQAIVGHLKRMGRDSRTRQRKAGPLPSPSAESQSKRAGEEPVRRVSPCRSASRC